MGRGNETHLCFFSSHQFRTSEDTPYAGVHKKYKSYQPYQCNVTFLLPWKNLLKLTAQSKILTIHWQLKVTLLLHSAGAIIEMPSARVTRFLWTPWQQAAIEKTPFKHDSVYQCNVFNALSLMGTEWNLVSERTAINHISMIQACKRIHCRMIRFGAFTAPLPHSFFPQIIKDEFDPGHIGA